MMVQIHLKIEKNITKLWCEHEMNAIKAKCEQEHYVGIKWNDDSFIENLFK